MTRMFDMTGDIVTEVQALQGNIDEDGSHVAENLQRLAAVRGALILKAGLLL